MATRFPLWTVLAATLLFWAAPGRAGEWPGWRGPGGLSHTDEKDLPLTWGGKKDDNVLWKVTVGGRGHSSPIVWGERVFVTTAGRQTDQEVKNKVIPKHEVVCYAAADGKELWRTAIPPGAWPDGNSIYAAPTPVTDGQRVYAWFGSGVLAALDFKGKLLWRREHAGPYRVYPSISSSPLLYKDVVLILCDQNPNGFLWAVDRKSGEVRREVPRKAGSTNSTPLLLKVNGKDELIVSAARALQGLDPDSGEVRWWCAKDGGYWNSLTSGAGLVYVDSGGGRGVAVEPTGTGDVDKTKVKWTHKRVPEGLSSPLIVGNFLYRAHKPGILKCWRLSTGEEVYSERLEGISVLASPFSTADGRVYFASARKTYVIRAGPKLEVLAVNALQGGDDGPSPAVSGGRIFVKSSTTLFCVGKK